MLEPAGRIEKLLFWCGLAGLALPMFSYGAASGAGKTSANVAFFQIGLIIAVFVSPVLMGGAFFLSGKRKDDYMAQREGKPVRLSWKIGRWLVLGIVPLITVLSVFCSIAAGSEAGWCVVMVPIMWAYTAPVMVLLGSLTMFLGGRFVT